MSTHDRRPYRHALRAGEVRQQFERHLESLRLRGVSFDDAVQSLAALVASALEEQEAARPGGRMARPAAAALPSPAEEAGQPPNAVPLLADLRAIPPRMSVNAAAALHLIRARRCETPSALSRELEVSPAAITGTVDTLVESGLVVRLRSEDRRKVILGLTAAGAELTERIFPAG